MFRQARLTRKTALAATAALFALAGGASLAAAADEKKAKSAPSAAAAKTKVVGALLEGDDLSRVIDHYIDERLRTEKVDVSPRADDAAFLRRASLDITGRIPTAEKAAAFLDNHDPAKRAKLIDDLLASKEYGSHQSDIWQALLLPRNSDNRRLQLDPMVKWLEESFNTNKPWDKMVREILTASGEQEKNAAVTFYLANATVDKMTDSVTKLFLGVQLQCAQCHNHPFTEWKQSPKRPPRAEVGTRCPSRPESCRRSFLRVRNPRSSHGPRCVPCWPTGSRRWTTRTSARRWSTASGHSSSAGGWSTPWTTCTKATPPRTPSFSTS
jgi:hypothetical protein